MAKTLAQFTITADGNGDYLLNLEDEDGEAVDITATFEQLDLMVEALQEQLDNDEEDALEVEDEPGEVSDEE
jgi:hypothetical protein